MSTDPDDPDRPGEDGPEQPREGRPEHGRHSASGMVDATHGHRAVPGDEIAAHEAERPVEGELEPDVERLHRAIFREPPDPREGREPVPWWLWAIGALVLFWGGWYLGHYGGPFGIATHTAYRNTEEFVAEEAGEQTGEAIADPIQAGQEIYTARCQSCHQPNGMGTPGVFPPLIGSEWVTGPPETVVRILLNGLTGPITVAGESYNGTMPGWKDVLSDAEIAAVATFIRQWEANDAPAVEPELVEQLRAETADRPTPWTAAELEQAGAAAPDTTAAGQDTTAAATDTTAQQP